MIICSIVVPYLIWHTFRLTLILYEQTSWNFSGFWKYVVLALENPPHELGVTLK